MVWELSPYHTPTASPGTVLSSPAVGGRARRGRLHGFFRQQLSQGDAMNPRHAVSLFFAFALPICFALAGCFSQSAPQAQDGNKNQETQGNAGTDGKNTEPSHAGEATTSAQKEARDALAKFDKENPASRLRRGSGPPLRPP